VYEFWSFKTFYDICANLFSVEFIFNQINSKYDRSSYPPKISRTTRRLSTARHLLGCDSLQCCHFMACLQKTDADDSLQIQMIFTSVCEYSFASRNLNFVVSNFTMGTTKLLEWVTVRLFRLLNNTQ
jgi:hypothetical protein